jgi:hypothetical protein
LEGRELENNSWLGAAVYACKFSYVRVDWKTTWFEASSGKRLVKCHFNQQAGCGDFTGGIGRRIAVRGWSWAKKCEPLPEK